MELLAGSDDVALRLDINMSCLEPVPVLIPNSQVHLPKDRDKFLAANLMDELLAEVNWDECLTQEKLVNLQNILIRANQEGTHILVGRT